MINNLSCVYPIFKSTKSLINRGTVAYYQQIFKLNKRIKNDYHVRKQLVLSYSFEMNFGQQRFY